MFPFGGHFHTVYTAYFYLWYCTTSPCEKSTEFRFFSSLCTEFLQFINHSKLIIIGKAHPFREIRIKFVSKVLAKHIGI